MTFETMFITLLLLAVVALAAVVMMLISECNEMRATNDRLNLSVSFWFDRAEEWRSTLKKYRNRLGGDVCAVIEKEKDHA